MESIHVLTSRENTANAPHAWRCADASKLLCVFLFPDNARRCQQRADRGLYRNWPRFSTRSTAAAERRLLEPLVALTSNFVSLCTKHAPRLCVRRCVYSYFNPLKTKRRPLYLTLSVLMSYIYGAPSKAHHVTRHNTHIHNILSTAPQLSIFQKALRTLPDDGNVMPKRVEATIHN
jgi:hypothetical protein